MKQFKGTPGPWKVQSCGPGYPESFELVVNTGGMAQRFGTIIPNKVLGVSISQTAANARLIAAAPELLTVLQDLLTRYTELVNSGDCGNWDPEEEKEVIQARNAINKAIIN
ncbi:hypothetical protein SNE25_21115 [Mucilaginibacter sabulilitoris]|uniref:Uncharacterized protein n=1 Tax=Mucilaginibacter sabulilitoris TaxID=1173583 RepID=A0ABZ0TGW6_9SPHI|nr:hypothetical protein [Mucilaginibacter sabulilitoris]WPU91821.1 hypothetical protein SNE25_21115 [Mucilaginibacter sabulilitoris]